MMVTVKNLLGTATTAALGALALSGVQGSRQQRELHASPLDSLDPSHGQDSGAHYGDYADAPTPMAPFFNGTGNSTDGLPCLDLELIAALELLIVDLDPAINETQCETVSNFNNDVFASLEGLFGPDVNTSNTYVKNVFFTLDQELTDIANFTSSTNACDNVTAYNTQVTEAVDGLYDTLSLLDNVTICEPYLIN